MIDKPKLKDNRNYNYLDCANQIREEYPIIVDWIDANSSVIDLGCGNGSLLELLIKSKNIKGKGIEISDTGVDICKQKGLDALKMRIDIINSGLKDKEFDFAICNVTMQMVMYPEVLLNEMGRISKYQIISFSNFAYYKNRLELLFNGVMPKTMLFDYKWYNTGHIHQFSINDFYAFLDEYGFNVIKRDFLGFSKNKFKKIIFERYPNLFSPIAIFMLEKK